MIPKGWPNGQPFVFQPPTSDAASSLITTVSCAHGSPSTLSMTTRNPTGIRTLQGTAPEHARDAGVYMLLIRVRQAGRIMRAHNAWTIVPGWYVYVGSAQRGLRARLARHARRKKRPHWHIDSLLLLGYVVSARVLVGAPRAVEARLARAWARAPGARVLENFGATDSPAASHLIGFSRRAQVVCHPLWRTARPWPLSRQ